MRKDRVARENLPEFFQLWLCHWFRKSQPCINVRLATIMTNLKEINRSVDFSRIYPCQSGKSGIISNDCDNFESLENLWRRKIESVSLYALLYVYVLSFVEARFWQIWAYLCSKRYRFQLVIIIPRRICTSKNVRAMWRARLRSSWR